MVRPVRNPDDGLPGLLKDGRSVLIRRLTRDDLELIVEFSRRLSRRTISMRMLGPVVTMDRAGLARFMNFDSNEQVGLVALHEGRAVGVADFVRVDGHPDRAEVTFTIVDEFQSLGLGGLLLEHIASVARDYRISVLEADVLAENFAMISTLESSGYAVVFGPPESVLHADIAIQPRAQVLARSDSRERQAVRSSMQRIFDSRTVAVVGAGIGPDNLGRSVVRNLVTHGFPGRVYAVNPNTPAVMGLPTHPTVHSIGEPVDLVVVAVNADLVPEVLRDCAGAGVAAVIVLSVGFGELGEQGRAAERDMVRYARGAGMRLIGPASMGILAQQGSRRLAATFSTSLPVTGAVAMASQSGTLGLAILEHASRIGLGISGFASLGRSADVSPNDLLQWWDEDPSTSVILLDLERFGNARKFARLARRVSAHKPIVTVTSAVQVSMTGFSMPEALDLGAVTDTLFSQTGIVATRTLAEMFDVARLFACQPVPHGNRVVVVTNATQPGALTAAACRAAGLHIASLGEPTRGVLRDIALDGEPADFIDLSPRADAGQYETALRTLLADDGVDAVIALFIPPLVRGRDAILAALVNAAGSVPGKTFVASFDGMEGELSVDHGEGASVPSYTFPEAAAAALGRAAAYGAWRRQPAGMVREPQGFAAGRVRQFVDRAGIGPVSVAGAAELLEAAGIDLVPDSGIAGSAVSLSVVVDRVFGPLLAFGVLGDSLALYGDVAFHITPVSDLDAMRLVRSVRAFPILAERDIDALIGVILRVAWLVEELPELVSLQLSPIVVGAPGEGVTVQRAALELDEPAEGRRHREPRVQSS
ncbi:GNAT family N-acetyltransferase [Nocardia sp. CA2R105]|uniref:bifunctional acetate--CoA ligase family protein/GNAT family N-acetyltransferase n=1 Tax=Nocardia coffeae TaxID=2873381 RepID=UPI001CA78AC6|nr:GNAT family N-acetyltransferase [Nocardia coffeae]MBY8862874.1 GNAT family N-acetyltransferase [Nocardia coffeae]